MTDPPDSSSRHLPQPYANSAIPQLYQPMPGIPGPERHQASLKDYLYILKRRKWLPVAVTATVLVLSALQVFTETPMYRATARLQINPGQADILPYDDIAVPGRSMASEQYLWTQAERLKSRDLASRVVDELQLQSDRRFKPRGSRGALKELGSNIRGLARGAFGLLGGGGDSLPDDTAAAPDGPAGTLSASSRQALEQRLLNRVRIRPLRRTRLIEVGFVSQSPELAGSVANAMAEEFIELNLQNRYEATIRATEFLQNQLDDLKLKVEVSEAALLEYAQTKGIVSVSESQTVNRKRFSDLSDEQTRLYNELAALRARYDAARRASGGTFPTELRNEQVRSLESRLSQIEGELAGYSSRYGPEWPAVKELRSTADGLRSQLVEARKTAIALARQDYLLAQTRYERISSRMGEEQEIVDRLADDSIEYKMLQREADTNKNLYQGLQLRLKEASVAASLDSSNIQVADRAIVPRVADSPKKTQTLFRALLLGLLLGLGSIVLAEKLDSTIKSPDDIDHFIHLPSLGMIPALFPEVTRSPMQVLLGRKGEQQKHEGPVLAFDVSAESAGGRAWEAYRSLRTSILLSSPAKAPQVLLVTSSLPGEGKSTTAINTAVALAQTGARTLLIDLDLRRPVVGQALDLMTSKGMSTFLTGNANLSSLIQQTAISNLYAVPAGPVSPNPPELLGSERMRVGLELARDFAHVVIDAPPCLELSDALILSRIVDGVVIVARGGKTPRSALARARDHLLRAQAPLLGVVLNSVDAAGLDYGGYYSSYYGGYYTQRPGDVESQKRTA